MTNAEAIETLRANYPDACYEQLREAVDVAIEALKAQDAARDTISRQAAIDAIDVLCQEHRYKIPGKAETYSQYNEAWQDALDRAEGAIGNLPSSQPERKTGHWMSQKGGGYCCSECGGYALDEVDGNFIHVAFESNFCPYCGAKMERKTDG